MLVLASWVGYEPLEGQVESRFAGGARVVTQSGRRFDEYVADVPGSPANALDQASVLANIHATAQLSLDSHEATELAAELLDRDAAASPDRPLHILRASAPRAAATT